MARGPKPYIQTVVWKYVDRGFKAAKKKYDEFTDAMGEATDVTRSMETRAMSNADTMKSMGGSAGEAADDVDDMTDSTRAAASVIDRMKNSSNGAVRALGQMGAKIRAAATSAKLWVAGGIVASIVAFSAAVGTATAKAIGFENALNEARKTADLSEQEFQALSKQLLEIQAELGTSQRDLAAIAAEAGRLGIEGTDNIAEFTRTVSLMSEATNVTADQAARGMARVTNAFGLPISRAKALGSVLNELSNQTVASTSDLIDALTRVGAAGAQLGLTADEVAGMAATLIDAGISARRAGTGLRTIFTRMLNESEAVADQMGVTREELLRTFEEDGVRAVKMYLSALRDMEKAQRAAAIEEIFGVEQSQKVQALVQNFGNMEKQIADAGEELKEADSLTAEFAKTTQDVQTEWNRLTAKLSAWVTEWGTSFTGYLEEALAYLNDISGGANELARDLTTASERLEGLDSDIGLIARFQSLQAQGQDTTKVLEEMQARFPDAFFEETADGIEVATGRLKEYVTQQRRMAEQSVQARQAQAVRELNSAYQNLQRAQTRSQQEGLSTEEWREYRKQIDQARERLEALAPVLVEQFAENGKVAREELQKLSESVDLRSFIGLDDISEDEAIDRLIQLWRTYREEKEAAADVEGGTVDGEGGEGGGDASTDEVAQPAGPDFAALAERARKISQNATQFLEDFGPARVEAVTGAFRDELSQLRLELERGAITQEEFQRRAADMASRYRGELIHVIERLEKMGLITPEVARKAVDGLKGMESQAEDSKEETEKLGQTLQDVARLTRGIAQLGAAVGGIGEEAEEALGGVSSMLDSVGRLVELTNETDEGTLSALFSDTSGAISGISTFVGVAGGLVQVGEALIRMQTSDGTADLEKLRSSIRGNVDALEENTEALFESARVGEDLTLKQLRATRQLLDFEIAANADPANLNEGDPIQQLRLIGREAPQANGDRLVSIFNDVVEGLNNGAAGLETSAGVLTEVKQALFDVMTGEQDISDIQIDNEDVPTDKVQEAIDKLLPSTFEPVGDTIDRLIEDFAEFGESMRGLSAEIKFRREQLGASFEDLRQVFANRLEDVGLSEGLTGAIRRQVKGASQEDLEDLQTQLSELLAGDKNLEDVFPAFKELVETSPVLDEAPLEGSLDEATPSEFRALIEELGGLASMGSGAGRDTRVTSQVQQTITEFQANELLTYQQEQMFTQRSMETHLAAIRSILAQDTGIQPSQSALTTLSQSGGQSPASGISEATFYVNADMSAEEIAQKMEEAIAMMN